MRTILKKTLAKFAKILELDLLIGLANRHLLLPFYHTVSDDDLVHIKYLYPVPTIARFKTDLDFLQKNFKPVSHTFLHEYVKNKNTITENCFFLSFDDGLREFYDIVAQILLHQGIPATCFINIAFIDNKDMFFRMKASILIDKINKKELSFEQKKVVVGIFNQHNLKYNSAFDLLRITDQNKEILDTIAPIVDVCFSEYLSKHQPYLTTNQINELIQKGFSIGAHSVSHPYYNMLPEETQVKQTLDCLHYLIDNFKIKERLFSFPYTDFDVKKTFFDKISNAVDLTFGTASLKLDLIKTNLQRTPMEVFGYKSAEDIVKPEYLYFILKRLVRKHVINRS
ncbi:MAG: polysaccharide deacetylase family protein [bacterium]